MSAELLAVVARLGTPGVPSFLVTRLAPCRRSRSCGVAGSADSDPATGGSCGAFSAPFGITCTGQDPQAALDLSAAVRDLLWPDQMPTVLARWLAVMSWSICTTPVRQVDRSVTLTTTNTHPAYVVLLGDVHSQPAPDT